MGQGARRASTLKPRYALHMLSLPELGATGNKVCIGPKKTLSSG